LGVVLLTVSLWLLGDNQSVNINASDRNDGQAAGTVGCTIAPYDAGFFGNDDPPGGEHSVEYSDEVATDCYSVNTQRFRTAVAAGIVGVVMLGSAISFGRARSSRFVA
jgi:hypothetical protein